MYNGGMMHLNHTHLVNKGATKLLPKSQIQEAELTLDPSIQQAAPLIAQLNADRTLATMLSLHIPQLRLESQAIKMQHNEGKAKVQGRGLQDYHDWPLLAASQMLPCVVSLFLSWRMSCPPVVCCWKC